MTKCFGFIQSFNFMLQTSVRVSSDIFHHYFRTILLATHLGCFLF